MTINEIINANVKVTEKIKMLNQYSDEQQRLVGEAKIKIQEGYKYCPMCKEYYKVGAFEKDFCEETRNKVDVPQCEFDEWKSHDVKGMATYNICPMGHRIEISFY